MEKNEQRYSIAAINRARTVRLELEYIRDIIDNYFVDVSHSDGMESSFSSKIGWISDQLAELYACLGNNASEVADTLGSMGLVGELLSVRGCPLARLGLAATGMIVAVDGQGRYIIHFLDEIVVRYLPQFAAAFRRDFDQGRFPWLECDVNIDHTAVTLASARKEADHAL